MRVTAKPVQKFAWARFAALLGVITMIATACGNKPLDTMAPNSPIGGEINRLFWGVMIVAGIVMVLVLGAIGYMSSRFRVKPTDDESAIYPDEEFPEQTHGNERLEVAWTILPALLMAVIGVFTLFTLVKLDDVSASENRQVDKITVVGQQWWWEYHYYLADGDDIVDFVTANEIVIPVGEEIELEITSRDVIHSFWIPRLNGKRDAVPGRTSPWTIEASKADRFLGQCTEFCGLSHAYMRMYAIAIEPQDFEAWAANQQTEQPILEEGDAGYEGQQVFLQQCATCHVINGVTDVDGDEVPDDWSLYGFRSADSDLLKRIIPENTTQVSGAAPNLTHLMTRTSFAGSIFDLYENAEASSDQDYAELASFATLDRGQLEAWIRNAPAEKANAWENEGGQRGMTPFLGLTGEQLDDVVDYLTTLD